MIVVDSCIVFKWFVTEDDSDAANALRGMPLSAPEIWMFEVAHAIQRSVRRMRLSSLDAEYCMSLLPRLPIHKIALETISQRSIELAFARNHAVYDCCYIATAERLEVPLVTTDKRLIDACNGGKTSPRAIHLHDFIRERKQ